MDNQLILTLARARGRLRVATDRAERANRYGTPEDIDAASAELDAAIAGYQQAGAELQAAFLNEQEKH